MPKISEKNQNLLGLYTFSYNSYQALVEVDTIHNNHTGAGKTIYFNIEANRRCPIKYGYQPGKGLVKFNTDNGSIEDNNILGELLNVSRNEPKKLVKFFMKYGTLFINERYSFTKYNYSTLLKVIDRLRWTVELMSQICEPSQRNYKTLLKLIFCLFYDRDIEILNHNKICFYKRTNELKQELETHIRSGSSYQYLDNGRAQANDEIDIETHTFEIEDCIYGKQTISIKEFEDIMGKSTRWTPTINALAFLHFENRNSKHIILWDLLYHFFKENREMQFQIEHLQFSQLDNHNFKIKDEFKEAILKVGKGMLASEINAHINNVRPQYSFDKLEPTWVVNDLITALYLSLFYMKPNVELIRKCQNPNCDRYFIIKTSSSRTKYCCTACGNAMAQARYRQNKKSESTD